MKTTLSGSLVLISGSVVALETDVVRLQPFGNDSGYFLEFDFSKSGADDLYHGENRGTGYAITVSNPKSDSFSSPRPLPIAIRANKEVYLRFAMQKVGADPATWLISYTVFEGLAE